MASAAALLSACRQNDMIGKLLRQGHPSLTATTISNPRAPGCSPMATTALLQASISSLMRGQHLETTRLVSSANTWCSPELVANQSCSVKSSMQAGVTMSNALPETLAPMSCSQAQQHVDKPDACPVASLHRCELQHGGCTPKWRPTAPRAKDCLTSSAVFFTSGIHALAPQLKSTTCSSSRLPSRACFYTPRLTLGQV